MRAPTLPCAIRVLRERLEASQVGMRRSPGQDALIRCPICANVFLESPQAHAQRHLARIKRERENGSGPLTEPFVLWQGVAPFTGWTPILSHPDTHPLVYVYDGATAETHHLVTGRAARWVLANAGRLRRSGVEVARRGSVLLIPTPIWEFLCSLAVHLTFEADADQIYAHPQASPDGENRHPAPDESSESR